MVIKAFLFIAVLNGQEYVLDYDITREDCTAALEAVASHKTHWLIEIAPGSHADGGKAEFYCAESK